jgi:hypothetical protein
MRQASILSSHKAIGKQEKRAGKLENPFRIGFELICQPISVKMPVFSLPFANVCPRYFRSRESFKSLADCDWRLALPVEKGIMGASINNIDSK